MNLAKLFMAMVATFVVGCGGGIQDATPRTDVSGTVTYKGTPVKAGRIVFTPDGKGGISVGAVSEGAFSVTDVAINSHIVTIEPPSAESSTEGEDVERDDPSAPDIPVAYTDVGTSPLRAQVKADATEFTFDLEDIEYKPSEDGEEEEGE